MSLVFKPNKNTFNLSSMSDAAHPVNILSKVVLPVPVCPYANTVPKE